MTAVADLLIGDSALLLYFSKSWKRSRKSTIVPIFRICCYLCLRFTVSDDFFFFFLFIYFFILLFFFFLSIVAMIVRIKQDDNYF